MNFVYLQRNDDEKNLTVFDNNKKFLKIYLQKSHTNSILLKSKKQY